MNIRKNLCGSCKAWCLLIGCLQFICGSLIAGLYSYFLLRDSDHHSSGTFASFAVFIVTGLLNLFAGLILIVGVRRKRTKQLMTWIVLELIILVLAIVCLVFDLVNEVDIIFTIQDASGIFFAIVFSAVVLKHRSLLLKKKADRRRVGEEKEPEEDCDEDDKYVYGD